MEQRAILLGIQLIDFVNRDGNRVKLTKLHLMDSDHETSNTFAGRHAAAVSTIKFDKSWYELIDQEVVVLYTLPLGSKNPSFKDIRLAQEA